MDGQHFDLLARRLARATSRRALIGGFAGAFLGGRFVQHEAAAQGCQTDDDCPGETTCPAPGGFCSCYGPQSTCTLDDECCSDTRCLNGRCCLNDGTDHFQQDPLSCCSGIIADRVCCSTSCEGECNQCNVAGSLGTCVDVNSNCLDMDPCTSNVCTAGTCSFPTVPDGSSTPDLPSGQICCDGEPCAAVDACTPACCTSGACNAISSCPQGTEYCVGGNCVECLTASDCTSSEDFCVETLCSANQCVDRPIDCSELDSTCHTGTCFNGTCFADQDEVGTACDAGEACLIGACDASGQCIGTPRDCSDLDDLCMTGICDAETGDCEVVYEENGTDCGQGAVCFNGLCICGEGRIVCDDQCVAGECCDASDCIGAAGGSSCGALTCVDHVCVGGSDDDVCEDDSCCCDDGKCRKKCCHREPKPPHGNDDIPIDTLPNTGTGSTAGGDAAVGVAIAGGIAAWVASRVRSMGANKPPGASTE